MPEGHPASISIILEGRVPVKTTDDFEIYREVYLVLSRFAQRPNGVDLLENLRTNGPRVAARGDRVEWGDARLPSALAGYRVAIQVLMPVSII